VGYKSRLHNYTLFKAALEEQHVHLLTVELAFGNAPHRLKGDEVVQVRGGDVLWQKERLLNIALTHLPTEFQKVVWLDADTIITGNNWPATMSKLLDKYAVVQAFERVAIANQLQQDWRRKVPHARQQGAAFMSRSSKQPRLAASGGGWGCRRDWWEKYGLYDRMIVGGGDSALFLAMLCDTKNVGAWEKMTRKLITFNRMNDRYWEDFANWAKAVAPSIYGKWTCMPGLAWCLHHGPLYKRNYINRHVITVGFNPGTDLELHPESGAWVWSENCGKPDMEKAVYDYMVSRGEDL